ncbi:hypothetical protein FGIG_09240 [Fasciola gigantica]|uniref:Uncharacterized protein n=1 Tax=Fasciola gigantica TaxID=46835 RepID=A0A504Y5C0_FASGI|nr:hypothetical protein FGIG_09240 [Fasciola gigantica]
MPSSLCHSSSDNPSEKRAFAGEVVPNSLAFGFTHEKKPRLTLLGAFNLVVWVISLCFFIYLLAISTVVRIYSISVQAVFVYLTYRRGGVSNCASQWVPGSPVVTSSHITRICFSSFDCVTFTHNADRMTDIYDVTVAYPDNLPSPETNMFFGGVPREVHYHVRHYPASDLPWNVDTESLEPIGDLDLRMASWLRARWLEKELMLRAYYDNPSEKRAFAGEVVPNSLAFGFTHEKKPRLTLLGAFNLVVWVISLCFFIYLLAISTVVRIYSISVQAVFVYLTYRRGGVSNCASQWVPGSPVVTSSHVCFTNSANGFGELTGGVKSAL